ncbi:MAG: hypothetical protein M0T84_06020 [Betaproteobacteria bacterium]|nr:hypothetical protein [Betaproteobacteria bacterium]
MLPAARATSRNMSRRDTFEEFCGNWTISCSLQFIVNPPMRLSARRRMNYLYNASLIYINYRSIPWLRSFGSLDALSRGLNGFRDGVAKLSPLTALFEALQLGWTNRDLGAN